MKFSRALLAIVAVAFGVRVAYVELAKGEDCVVQIGALHHGSFPSECPVGDQLFYNSEANRLADGDGFVEPLWSVTNPGEDPPPAADHPPLTVVVLGGVSWLVERPPLAWIAGDDLDTNVREHRYAMVALGTLLVWLVGLLARRVGGDVVGLVAASIAAVSPNVWVNDGLMMSETIGGVAVVGVLLLALDVIDQPTANRIALLGAGCGVAALTRAELALLVPLLAVPLAVRRPDVLQRIVTPIGAAALVCAPWVVYNMARFDEPTFLSTNDGIALAGSNCDPVYSGEGIGLTSFDTAAGCIDQPHPPGDQSEVAKIYRDRAVDYARDHLGRAPVVALARVGRTWSLFRPFDMIDYNQGEGRESWVTRLGLVAYYPTLVAAAAGAVLLWRQRKKRVLWVLAVPTIIVTLGSALTYGQTRFRAAAEPSLAILAAVALVAGCRALQERGTLSRTRASSSPADTSMAAGSGEVLASRVNAIAASA
ncbi:MAG: glycosyltransferase family 39 protein [Actinomycetota bacterium]